MQDYLKSPQRLNEQVACIEVLGLIRPVELIEQVSCREDIVLGAERDVFALFGHLFAKLPRY
ncbi:hypothetical protein D3C84_544800 [compost metagenome]